MDIAERISRYLTNIAKAVADGYCWAGSWAKGGWLRDIASRIWQVFMSWKGGVSKRRWRNWWS